MTPDPDNPLPEASFRYRRIFTFIFTVAILGLLYFLAGRMPAEELRGYSRDLLGVMALLWFFYFGGASADDVGRLVARVKLPFRPRAAALPADPGAAAPGAPWERG